MKTALDAPLVLGDLAHLSSFLILAGSILWRKSAAGWSGRSQVLTFFVFVSRYWDFWSNFGTYYQICTKTTWIFMSLVIMYLIFWEYKSTYEKQFDTFWIESIILASGVLAIIYCSDVYSLDEILWLFSRFVETLSILPQYYFVFQKGRKNVMTTYYVVILIYYRLFYLGHWMNNYLSYNYYDNFVLIPGICQLVLYSIYFFFPKGKRKENTEEAPTVRRNIPQYLTQSSLLETPLLKRSATSSSSIYIIGTESNYSTLERSVYSYGSGSSDQDQDRS